jgi:lactoylglutathione lyase
MPNAAGLFETHLTVSDLDRSIEFCRDIVGLTLAPELPERRAAFFWIRGAGEAMLGLWSLESAPTGLALHIALKVSVADLLGACNALRSNGVTPLSFFGTETTEPKLCRVGTRERRDDALRSETARLLPRGGHARDGNDRR